MTRATWPPVPPGPPPPPFPPQPPQYPPPSPWRPEPRPSVHPAPSVSVVVGAEHWLAERLLEQRVVALAGALDADDVNRAVAELALLDASGDEPVQLRLSGVSGRAQFSNSWSGWCGRIRRLELLSRRQCCSSSRTRRLDRREQRR